MPINIYIKELQDILSEFKMKAYAGGDVDIYKDTPHGTKRFEDKIVHWNFSDEFDGDACFAGEERLSRFLVLGAEVDRFILRTQPVGIWHMVYSGRILSDTVTKKTIFDFLRKALQAMPVDLPFRGSLGSFTHEDFPDFEYRNELLRGKDVTNATGIEEIYVGDEKLYEGFSLFRQYTCSL